MDKGFGRSFSRIVFRWSANVGSVDDAALGEATLSWFNLPSMTVRLRVAIFGVSCAQRYAQCFNAFVADSYAAVRGRSSGEAPDGLPTFADGARAATIRDAMLDSAGNGTLG